MARRPAHAFPFSAIVGQETLKTALLLNAVDSRVGGVLVRGEKGTAKSTAVRALGAILPALDVNEGCRFSCDPSDPGSWCPECQERRERGPIPKVQRPAQIVDLPVSATEDRLVGTLDLEHALKHGERVYEPGLLARANRSILYVDEVNLLDDHLVDTLLDAAAMGVNTVEREGVSFSHPARFILVGTMNPEEGDLRPQLLDRFGLCVDVESVREPESRVEIVRRRRQFEEDPRGFFRAWQEQEAALSATIRGARLRLPAVALPDPVLYAIANLALTAGVDGHRADQVMARGAVALAALDGRPEATLKDVASVAPLVLAHRMRRTLFDEPRLDSTALATLVSDALGLGDEEAEASEPSADRAGAGQTAMFDATASAKTSDVTVAAFDATIAQPLDATRRSIRGRRHETVSDDNRGRYVRSEPMPQDNTSADIALDASLRAAAVHQQSRASESDLAVTITPAELHKKVRTRKVGATIVFAVDASGSMGATNRMAAAKAAVLDLLVDAYQRRDRVSLVSFGGTSADVVLAPTASVELANMRTRNLATGGATPLAAGILKALEVVEGERRRSPEVVPWIVLVTDGRGNVGISGGSGSDDALAAARKLAESRVHSVIVDTGIGRSGGGAALELARAAGGEYVRLSSMDGTEMSSAVKRRLNSLR